MAWTQTYRGAEPQRINKWMAQAGVCSRREAEAFIEQGFVSIDGQVVTEPGRKIEPGQTLILNDSAQKTLGDQMTLVIHKPEGLVSAHPEPHQQAAYSLVTRDRLWAPREEAGRMRAPGPDDSFPPLGRLDQDSRGLLLLSEDGVLAKAVIGPESEIEKEYLVRVRGQITDRKIAGLRHGLYLDGRALLPAKVNLVDDQQLRIILKEGRNRQIRRMCEAVGLYVTDLLRIRVGPVHLGGLPEGMWRPLTGQERADLIAASTMRLVKPGAATKGPPARRAPPGARPGAPKMKR
jgi:23S rRNA pseudouridine2604 synthase